MIFPSQPSEKLYRVFVRNGAGQEQAFTIRERFEQNARIQAAIRANCKQKDVTYFVDRVLVKRLK